MLDFNPHGKFQVYEDGQILILKAEEEAWNLETSKAVSSRMIQFSEKMAAQDSLFEFIADTQRIEGITSDSIELWFSVFEPWYKNGHRAFARVGDPHAMNYQIYHSEFDQHFKNTIDFYHAPTIARAIEWMHEKGFSGFKTHDFL